MEMSVQIASYNPQLTTAGHQNEGLCSTDFTSLLLPTLHPHLTFIQVREISQSLRRGRIQDSFPPNSQSLLIQDFQIILM